MSDNRKVLTWTKLFCFIILRIESSRFLITEPFILLRPKTKYLRLKVFGRVGRVIELRVRVKQNARIRVFRVLSKSVHCKYLNAWSECNDIVISVYSHYPLVSNAKSSDTKGTAFSVWWFCIRIERVMTVYGNCNVIVFRSCIQILTVWKKKSFLNQTLCLRKSFLNQETKI